MTWADVIRSYIPDADDDLCDFILWEKTCYPVGGEEEVREQIREFAETYKSGAAAK